ncbi:flagellar biosynthesis protein FlgA [Paenibacillus sp. GSMTC-2017]|uniref:SAF domain-containing protein n=1 Tax=Paenibacillus sp. GSMTC-2017 TaxID=2794350 RepID=UPI0018D99291|nr:SAF domain-containing protein [Paenibacillus sp. GSMTC-2017]MBH5320148.1 flagellar biosynthesis protein FlgA [Paenibacillus sp. GSMTC-2017]
MRGRRNVWMSVTAALLSAALVYGLYVLQRQQLEQQETIEVVVPKRFISAGERIERNDLEVTRLSYDSYSEEMVTDMGAAAGKEAAIPLGKGEVILSWKFNDHHLQPSGEEATFQIPKDYIRSVSNGIRAGDRVLIYVSGQIGESRRIFQQSVVVASVKSSGNVEIDSLEQSHLLSLAESNKDGMYVARRDANAMIEYVNLNLTEKQWLEIDGLCKSGENKLVVAYSSESFSRLDGTTDSAKEGEGK